MSMLLEAVDTMTDFEFTAHLDCESPAHARGTGHHDPAAPGAFFITSPCHGPRAVICAPRVAYLRMVGLISCSICGRQWLTERYKIDPIEGSTT